MRDGPDQQGPYDLMGYRPQWAISVVARLSIVKAVQRLQERQGLRRARALAAAGAIHTIQDQTKAMRCFLMLSGWSVAVAIGYGCIAEPVISAIWALNTPLLIMNAEKAWRLKSSAAEIIERHQHEPSRVGHFPAYKLNTSLTLRLSSTKPNRLGSDESADSSEVK